MSSDHNELLVQDSLYHDIYIKVYKTLNKLEECVQYLLPIRSNCPSLPQLNLYRQSLQSLRMDILAIPDRSIKFAIVGMCNFFIQGIFRLSCKYLTCEELVKVNADNIRFSSNIGIPLETLTISDFTPKTLNNAALDLLSKVLGRSYNSGLDSALEEVFGDQLGPYPPEIIEKIRSEIESALRYTSVRGSLSLFGSSRSGIYSAGSDIDLVLTMNEFEQSYLSLGKDKPSNSTAKTSGQPKGGIESVKLLGLSLQSIQERYYALYFFIELIEDITLLYCPPRTVSLGADICLGEQHSLSVYTILVALKTQYSSVISTLQSQITDIKYQMMTQNLVVKDQLNEIRSSKKFGPKSTYVIASVLKNRGYIIEETRSNARVPVCKIIEPIYNIPCDIVINYRLGIFNSDMIRTYTLMDPTNKVFRFLLLVKRFIKSRKISDASKGYLSSYSWTILALHVLLRHGFLPSSLLMYQGSTFCEGFDVSFDHEGYFKGYRGSMPYSCTSLLSKFSVIQLFHLFLEYIVSIDINTVVSLRLAGSVLSVSDVHALSPSTTESEVVGDGEDISGKGFPINNKWNIEDPFEDIHSVTPHNLGRTIWQSKFPEMIEIIQYSLNIMNELSGDLTKLEEPTDGDIEDEESAIDRFLDIFDSTFEVELSKKKKKKKKRKPRVRSSKAVSEVKTPPETSSNPTTAKA